MPRKNSRKRTTTTIEAQLASRLLPNDAPDLEEALVQDSAPGGVCDLFDRLCRQLGSPAEDSEFKRLERIQRALPEELKKELVKYDDARGAREVLVREAAYLVGVEVGRRMAGGAK